MSGLSHTGRYATGVEVIQAAQYGAYLKARSAVHHKERSSKTAQIFWSAPQRRWLKVYSGTYNGVAGIIVEYHPTCPCAMT